jgi:hypothetical protein
VYLAPSLSYHSNARQPATSDLKTIAIARQKIFAARRTVRPHSPEAALADYRRIIQAIAERRRAMAQLNVRRFAGVERLANACAVWGDLFNRPVWDLVQ